MSFKNMKNKINKNQKKLQKYIRFEKEIDFLNKKVVKLKKKKKNK